MPQPLQKLREATPTLGVLAGLCLVIVGIWVVWKVPKMQVQHAVELAKSDRAQNEAPKDTSKDSVPFPTDRAKQLELEDNFRKTIAQILGGAFLLLGLYYSARTFGLSRQGHITDRFTKAVEQLGKVDGNNPNIEVRLGGIYALERIAIDSPRDFETITKILTAYVRRNAPLEPGRPYTEGEGPRTDIQAILTVLGQPNASAKRKLLELPLDLSNTRLCGAKLSSLNLQKTVLINANLRRAYLRDANVQDSNLRGANLHGAHLWCAQLQGAFMDSANLQDANLWRANVQGAYLRDVNLEGADLQAIKGWTLIQIRSTIGWETALYSPDLREALGLSPKETNRSVATCHLESDKREENG